LTKRPDDHDRTETSGIIILLIAGVIFLPWFFTQTVFSVYNFSTTGQIGDTIGGITAPFINGIGAILVYLAFKEQVKATHQTRNLEQYKIINDRVNWLKGDPYDIVALENTINIALATGTVQQHPFNKATYLLIEFEQLFDMASKLTEEKENIIRQTQYLYRILYRDRLNNVQLHSITYTNIHPGNYQSVIVADYMLSFQSCDDKLRV
jgi:hypothetical protein